MNSEIFRFSIVRNPQRISREKFQQTVVRLISEEPDEHPFYQELRRLRAGGAGRERLLTRAGEFLNSTTFINSLDQLKLPFAEFSEWLYKQKKPTGNQIKEKAAALFGMEVFALIEHDNFKQDKIDISDSLVVAAIVKPKKNGLRGDLMRARRLVFLLENLAPRDLAAIDSGTVRRTLSATVLLPADLFPIPDDNAKRREENRKAYEKQKENIEKEQARLNKAAEKLKANEEAIDELARTYSKHLFELKYSENADGDMGSPGSGPGRPNNTPMRFLSVLPVNKFDELSSQTKKIIQEELKISKEQADVAYIVTALENENNRIGKELAQANLPAGAEVLADPIYEVLLGPCKKTEIKEPKAENDFASNTKGEVEVVGIQDLLIVRQELLKYEPGEIAHIENILQGESKNKKHRKLDRSEVTTFEETEKTEETEEELQTTDRYELQSEASKTLSEDHRGELGATYTGPFGWGEIEAHANYSYNRAEENSSRSASTIAKDIVSRSAQKIKERILKRRSRTDISEIEIINEHGFDNKQGEGHVTGVYRWVDKYYTAQIVNYGKRTMLEFMVPEPAAFYRFALANKPKKENSSVKPDVPGFCNRGVFYQLKPTDLSPTNSAMLKNTKLLKNPIKSRVS